VGRPSSTPRLLDLSNRLATCCPLHLWGRFPSRNIPKRLHTYWMLVINFMDSFVQQQHDQPHCRQCVSPSTSRPSGFIHFIGLCFRGVKFHDSDQGFQTEHRLRHGLPGAGRGASVAVPDGPADGSDHPAKLIRSRRPTSNPESISSILECEGSFRLVRLSEQHP
jgi:hypothetical protein